MSPYLVRYPGAPAWALPDPGQHGPNALQRLYPCAEGWAFVGCVTEQDWESVAATLGLGGDPRFADAASRRAHDHVLVAAIGGVLSTEPAAAWHRRARAHDAPLVAVSDVPKDEWMEDEKLLIEASHPELGEYWRAPVRVGFERLRPRLGPAAAAGEHTRRILAELGRSPADIESLLGSGAAAEWAAPQGTRP